MLSVDFLPARFGDCIWIEYGDAGNPHRVLIDGGTAGTRHDIARRLEALAPEQRRFELLVVTHIDRDHIEGVLELLEDREPRFAVRDLWFNGWNHLPGNPENQIFSVVQGERLTQSIVSLGLPWNKDFCGKAVMVPDDGRLPVRELPGGMTLTLLSPTREALADLKPEWEQEVRAANLDPEFPLAPDDTQAMEPIEAFDLAALPDVEALAATPFEEDETVANGSSIAFILEFEGVRLLFAGDAHPSVLVDSLHRLSPEAPVALDLLKVPHHGSEHNVNRALLEKLACSRYAFSTNGAIYHHPAPAAVARVIVWGGDRPELVFNYRSRYNAVWELPLLRNRHGYKVLYPDRGDSGITITF